MVCVIETNSDKIANASNAGTQSRALWDQRQILNVDARELRSNCRKLLAGNIAQNR
ncbi:hypothetical protein D9M69_729120 [compost metagenome]